MSLRARILAMIALAMLVSIALMGLRFSQNRSKQIADDLADLSAAATDVASDLDGKIQATAQFLYGLSRARDLDTRDKTACSSFLSDVHDAYPQFTGLVTVDPDGMLFCDSLRSGRTIDLNDRRYVKQALTTYDGVTLEPVFGRITGNSVLQIAYPFRSEIGKLKFILMASLDLRLFAKYHSQRMSRGKAIFLVDQKGTVLVQPSQRDWFKPAGATIADTDLFRLAASHNDTWAGEVAGIDGGTQVWAGARSPAVRDAGIYFMVGQSRDDLVAVANRRFVEDLVIHTIISVLLFAGVLALADVGVRRQIRRLSAMATTLHSGDLTVRIPPPYPTGELGKLMTLLNGAAGSLEKQRTSINDLNDQLRQSQKMDALGQLTGGLAHDFNNLLTVIQGNSELLVEQLAGNDDLCQMARMSLTASKRAAELTCGLLAFARRQPLEPKVVNVNLLISGMEPLLYRTLGADVEISVVRGNDLWLSLVDPSQLEAAVLNLCINARDAMEDGGRLSIETANTYIDDDATFADLVPGEYVMIAVSDNGSGISPENLDLVFDPFFTTKDVGKGTGLGLSMVYGFVKQSCGQIRIYSEVGHGTSIKMFLPRSGDAHYVDDEASISISDLGGSEKILLVEDNELVRQHVERQLLALGYDVTSAGDGPTALAIVSRREDIDLLFTDIVMPHGMNGQTLAIQSRKIRPGLKVLYTSGYTENVMFKEGHLAKGTLLLSKPYSHFEMARKIRAVLASAPYEETV